MIHDEDEEDIMPDEDEPDTRWVVLHEQTKGKFSQAEPLIMPLSDASPLGKWRGRVITICADEAEAREEAKR